MVHILRNLRRGGRGGKNFNYKVVALIALAAIGATTSFGFASGQIAVAPGSLLAAVFNVLSPKPVIKIVNSTEVSPDGSGDTIPATGTQKLATFNVSAANVTNWATLKTLEFEVNILDANATSPLSLSNFEANYRYCVPSGKTYGYGYKGGNCGSTKMQVVGLTKLPSVDNQGKYQNAYRFLVTSYQPVYPQQTPGVLSISAAPKYATTGSGNSKVRVAIVSGSGSGDQCSKFNSSVSNWAYSGCSGRQTFVSVPVYGNVLSVTRSTLPPQPTADIKATLISATETVTAGPAANDDMGTFEIKYNVTAVGGTAYVSANASEKNFISIDRGGLPVTAGISRAISSGSTSSSTGLYEIPSGTTMTFTVMATVQLPAAGSAGLYHMVLDEVHWTKDPKDSTPDLVTRLGRETFKTNYIALN